MSFVVNVVDFMMCQVKNMFFGRGKVRFDIGRILKRPAKVSLNRSKSYNKGQE